MPGDGSAQAVPLAVPMVVLPRILGSVFGDDVLKHLACWLLNVVAVEASGPIPPPAGRVASVCWSIGWMAWVPGTRYLGISALIVLALEFSSL